MARNATRKAGLEIRLPIGKEQKIYHQGETILLVREHKNKLRIIAPPSAKIEKSLDKPA